MNKSNSVLTEEMFADWLQHPVTELLRQRLLPKVRESLRDAWEAGNITAESVEGTAQLNATAIGRAGALRWLEQMTFEQMREELNDE